MELHFAVLVMPPKKGTNSKITTDNTAEGEHETKHMQSVSRFELCINLFGFVFQRDEDDNNQQSAENYEKPSPKSKRSDVRHLFFLST